MMKRLLFVVLAFMCSQAYGASRVSVERGFDAMSAINQDVHIGNAAKSERLRAYYDAHLAVYQVPSVFGGLSNKDVGLLFRSAYLAYFYSYQEVYLEHMRLDMEALSLMGPLSEKLVRDFYASLVTARRFREAEAFRSRHPLTKMPAMPPVEDSFPVGAAGPTVLTLQEHGGSRIFERKAVNVLGPGSWVLVISHQLCHFSQNAAHAIAADPLLAPVFRDHSQWISPPESAMTLSSLAEWNRGNLDVPIGIAYRESDWPMLSSWATPTFYFFKDGRLVRQVTGWPAEGNREALIAALRETGLLK